MNIKKAGVICTFVACLVGCRKTLDNSLAAKLTNSYVTSKELPNLRNGELLIPLGGLSRVVNQRLEASPELLGAVVLGLIRAGFIEKTDIPVTFPNFSGTYHGSHQTGEFPVLPWDDYISLAENGGTEPPTISGAYTTCLTQCTAGVTATGTVSGRVNESMAFLTFSPRVTSPFDQPFQGQMRLTPSGIVGNYNSAQFSATGSHNGSPITQTQYSYHWSRKMPRQLLVEGYLAIGKIYVVQCEDLLLNSETSARAACKLTVHLNAPSEVIFNHQSPVINSAVTFGKQPDGEWVVTNVQYNVPSISL